MVVWLGAHPLDESLAGTSKIKNKKIRIYYMTSRVFVNKKETYKKEIKNV